MAVSHSLANRLSFSHRILYCISERVPVLSEIYLGDCVIDELYIVFAVETHSMATLVAILVDDKAFEIATGIADEFETAFAFVDAVEFEHVELSAAELALIGFVAFVDAFVYQLFQEHTLLLLLLYLLDS